MRDEQNVTEVVVDQLMILLLPKLFLNLRLIMMLCGPNLLEIGQEVLGK